MKNLFAITSICLALALFASCSSVQGSYEGPVDVSGGLYGRGENIVAVVEKKGGTRTIDFIGSGFIKNCKLEIYPSEESSAGSGQTCEISPAGETEVLTVDRAVFFDESNAGLKAIRVIITGKTRGSGKVVEVTYKGFNSK
jgi:hypothetical protein